MLCVVLSLHCTGSAK